MHQVYLHEDLKSKLYGKVKATTNSPYNVELIYVLFCTFYYVQVVFNSSAKTIVQWVKHLIFNHASLQHCVLVVHFTIKLNIHLKYRLFY